MGIKCENALFLFINFMEDEMKKLSVVLIVCIFYMLLSSQYLDSEEKVKGGYKKCTVFSNYFSFGKLDIKRQIKCNTMKYDKRGNVIEFVHYGCDGYTPYKDTYKYDTEGHVIEHGYYESSNIFKIEIYTYNNNGNMIESTTYDPYGKVYAKVTCKYNTQGNRIDSTSFGRYGRLVLNSKFTWVYNNEGKKIEQVYYNEDEEVDSKETYKYDDKGNLIEKVCYAPWSTVGIKEIYNYDDKGNLIVRGRYISEYEVEETYKYDDKGNQTEKVSYDSYGSVDGKYSYKYDGFGNRIEEIKLNEFNEPVSIMIHVYSK
jgi:hypothetical protein